MKKLPGGIQRVKAYKFSYDATEMIMGLRKHIETYLTMFKKIQKDKRLLLIMQHILSVGNFLNGDSKRGNHAGFTFKTLMKATTTKTTDNKKTLITVLLD